MKNVLKKDWIKSTVKFTVDGKPVKFEIIHNLATQNYKLEGPLLDNWLARTETFDCEDLVKYINSKSHMTDCYAMTLETYENLVANQ